MAQTEEEKLKYQKEYYKKNKEQIKIYQKQYRLKNKEKFKIYQDTWNSKWIKQNKDTYKYKRYYQSNKHILKYVRQSKTESFENGIINGFKGRFFKEETFTKSDLRYIKKMNLTTNDKNMIKTWKDIPGYEGLYQVSALGDIKNIKFNTEKYLVGRKYKTGYSQVVLCKNKKQKAYLVHRLVAQSFLGLDITNTKMLVLHKKESLIEGRLNNGVDNLFLGTHKDNMKDMVAKGRCKFQGKSGKYHPTSKSVNQYTKEGEFIKTFGNAMDIQRKIGISQSNISACCRGIQKKAGGFIWKFTI